MDGIATPLTQQTEPINPAQVASDAARAYMEASETAAPPEAPPPVVEAPPVQADNHDWVVKAQFFEAQKNIIEEKYAALAAEQQAYLQFERDLQEHGELREAVEGFYRRKRNPQAQPPPQAAPPPQASPQGTPEAAAPPQVDPRVAQAVGYAVRQSHDTAVVSNKMAEDFYRAELDRQVERLTAMDPAFNKQAAALAAKDFNLEIRDLDKAWEIAKDPFIGTVMRQYSIPVERFNEARNIAAGIRNPQAVQQQYPPQYAPPSPQYQPYQQAPNPYPPPQTAPPAYPVQQVAPAVRIPAPSAPIPTTPAPFAPRPGMRGHEVSAAAVQAWTNGTLHGN